jgi:DNA-binding GntR family transcriptional regulator
LALTGVRHAAAGGEPIGYTTAFVRADLVDALPDIELEAGAIFSQLSERKGFTVDRIEQEILAMPLPRAVARRLQAEPDAPALTVIRRFWSEQIGAFEVSVNIHPADRFRYSITLERAAMPPAGDSSGPEVVIPR